MGDAEAERGGGAAAPQPAGAGQGQEGAHQAEDEAAGDDGEAGTRWGEGRGGGDRK